MKYLFSRLRLPNYALKRPNVLLLRFFTEMLFSFLPADVKRKKPESNKSLSTKLITPPQKSYKSTAVQSHEVHDRSQVQSKPRYQYLSTAHNYPYPSQNLVRKNVHMPFITPFAVNPGSTFINLPGSSSTMFGKHGEQDEPARIAHSNTQDEEKQLLQQPENEKFDKTKIATETFSPWRHHSYQVTQEPATTPINTAAYGNEVGYQVMIQNQIKYANYTPTQSTNYVYSSLPLVTSYRNYGDNPESTYYPSLMNYNGPTNSIVSLPYRPPHMERSYNNVTTIKGHRSGIKSEHFPSCDSRFPEHSGNVFSNVNDEAESQCVSHENTAFTYITASDQEKECVEEKKR